VKWFRMYHSVIDSVKVRRLPEGAQLDYMFVLCLASEYRERTKLNTGETGVTPAEAAWRCRRDGMESSIHLMQRQGLVELRDGLLVIPDWVYKQYDSDDSAIRVKKHRDTHRHTACNVTRNVTVTAPDTDTEADTETTSMSELPSATADVLPLRPLEKGSKTRREAAELLAFLNAKTNRHFRATDTTLKPIVERLKEGFSPDECRAVIVRKAREWGRDDKMRPFLRPETLFGATKFAQYIGEVPPEVSHGS
jgi:uncharacterized phage protein (TIGR02220 family)